MSISWITPAHEGTFDVFEIDRSKVRRLVFIGQMIIRRSTTSDHAAINQTINEAAESYRGIIPADCWHEPYMSEQELASEIAAGVEFWVAVQENTVIGAMGIQDKGEAALIRHAYVTSAAQGRGVGSTLLRHISSLHDKRMLVGTWADASWAIAFYQNRGFTLVNAGDKDQLLKKYWSIPPRQVETSVVLARD